MKVLLILVIVEYFETGGLEISSDGCHFLEVKCKGTEGPCIPIYSMCDGYPDCKDGWDEEENNCPDCFGFQCPNNGSCISSGWLCDGEEDCDSGDDEKVSCPACRRCSGLDICLPMNWVCDGFPDCEDKSDEEECNNREMPTAGMPDVCDGIRCPTGFCATYNVFTCNGINDCGDWSDERGCPCEKGMIDCGRCIPESWWCDSFPDCPYDDDEKNCSEVGTHNGYPVRTSMKFLLPVPGDDRKMEKQVLDRLTGRLSPDLERKIARKQVTRARTSVKKTRFRL